MVLRGGFALLGGRRDMLRRAFIASALEDCVRLPLLMGRQAYPAPALVADGDSITRGYGLATPTTQNWFARMVADARLAALTFTAVNSGTDSETVAQMLADVATDVDAHFVADARFVNFTAIGSTAILFGGTNSLYFGTAEATLRTQQIQWCEDRQAEGFYVVYLTMLPRGGDAPGSFAAARTANNAYWNASGLDHCDLVVNVGAIAEGANVLNATYYQDEVHPTAALAQLIGTMVADAFCAELGI